MQSHLRQAGYTIGFATLSSFVNIIDAVTSESNQIGWVLL